MHALELATWNVLHRVHATNWSEPLPAFPDERERERAVAALVARQLADGVRAVALQECSGDQLAALRAALGAGARVLDFELPRRPWVRLPWRKSQLHDATEHLVVVATGHAQPLFGEAYASDGGKGFFAVDLGEVAFFSTHVTYGEKSALQLKRLRERAERVMKHAVIGGDFNASAQSVAAALGAEFQLLALDPSTATRPRASSEKPQAIDHLAVRGGSMGGGRVIDSGGASDHHLVRARVELEEHR